MQDLANGHLDVKALGEAANGDENTIVTTRTGNTYPSAERAINIMFKNGGLPATPFPTKALMTASALVDGKYAQVTDDTVNNGLYVKTAGAWVKSGYDPLGQAKSYADASKLDLASITYAYTDGNIVGNKTKTVEGYGLNTLRNYGAGTTYTSKIIPVSAGYDLHVLNDKANYSASAGNGYAFFDDDPSVNVSAIRITDNRVAAVDPTTSLKYERVTVPVGAKYLVINSRFNTDINWAIHKGVFSSSYEQGTEVLLSVNGATIKEQLKPSLINTLEQGNKVMGDLYQPSGVIYNRYLNTNSTLVAGAGGMDWRAFRFKVSEGSSYYLKIVGAQTFPFRIVYSKSFDGVSENTTFAGLVTRTLTNQENIYKITVPTGLGIVAVFINIKVDSGSFTLNLADTLSIQEGHFEDADIGKSGSGISSINGNAIVDTYARAKLDEQGSVGSKSRLSGKKVFAFGDSITDGTAGGYVKYLEAAFDTSINNYGSSGGRVGRVVDQVTAGEGLPKRNTATAGTEWSVMDFTDLACVTLMIGTNDSDGSKFGALEDIPTTNIGDHATPAEYWALFPNNYLSNIALVIEYIKLKAPKCEIHLITPPHKYNIVDGITRITKLIPYLEAVAKYYGVHLIYATYESGISYKFMDGSLDFYSYDGTHFNERGNEVFGKFLAQKILSFG